MTPHQNQSTSTSNGIVMVLGRGSSTTASLRRIAARAFHSSPALIQGIHVFQCPDVVGIVAKLAECISSRGGNINSVDVFVPENKQVFYSRRHGIPYYYLPTTSGNKREEEILELVEDTDFLVLARYMQILSGSFLKTYGKDVINIHHGLLPSFKGGNPSKQAFDAGVKLIGATSHFVTEELDEGPIIEQMVERVSHRDTLQSFVLKSENLEKQCLAQAIKSYCELRVLPYESKKTVVF
ncbi:formyltetrahydrofolate deformylase 2, mitochondrial isoform X2 [Typha angustifolia]|uniref:formyltetrahydrofolate deformylase 2, mitochondrial isoform X2 n=1 Tax=Typha angustifolia TaxID=59011 RepID=UPI003C2BD290